MADNLLSMAGWYVLPNLVTGWVQSAYYAIWIRAGEPKPQPGSRAFVSHRRKIHILVILAYLLYTIYEADHQLRVAGDFYQDLGVSHEVGDRGLQSRFRRLGILGYMLVRRQKRQMADIKARTVQYHPDKVVAAEARPGAEAFYVHLKLCRDVLVDPAKRFAYDRFGPEMLAWRQSSSIREFVTIGIKQLAMYYTGTGVVLVLLGVLGYMNQAPFWRFLALASLFTFELHAMTSLTFPALLTSLINPFLSYTHLRPPYLPFQAISLFRKLILTFFIALSQIGPLLVDPTTATSSSGGEISQQQLQRLGQLGGDLQREANMLMGLEMTPFEGDVTVMQELRGKMRRFLVDNTVRSDLGVRSAVGRVLEKRRQGVPHGAVGAR